MDYVRRYEAALATKIEFEGKSLDYKKVDCLRMAAFCLRQLGHRNPTKAVRKYSSELGCVRALKASGFANLIEAVDAYGLKQIAPAQTIAGDLVAIESPTFGGYALGVALGENRFLGMDPNGGVGVAEIWPATHAWRSL